MTNADGEPHEVHDLRCAIWTSHDPCTCRDEQGKSPRDERFAARTEAEEAWHGMTLCERAEEIDRITSGGAA